MSPSIPQFTADLSVYHSNVSYVGRFDGSASQVGIVSPTGIRSWFRDRAYELAEFLERNKSSVCSGVAGTAGGAVLAGCLGVSANPVCVAAAVATTNQAYDSCMAD